MEYKDIISEIPSHGKKDIIKQSAIIIVPIALPFVILAILLPIDVKPFVNEYIPNYKILMGFMPTEIQIIMGSIVVISIFYLGKVQDYRKDLIINHAKFMLLLKNESDLDKKETIRIFYDTFKDILKVHRDSKKIIIYGIITMLVIFSTLLISTISQTEPNEDYFIVLSVLMISLIIQFLSYWYFFENQMDFSESVLNLLIKSYYFLEPNSS